MSQAIIDELIAVIAICGCEALQQVHPEVLRPALQDGVYHADSFPQLQGNVVQATLQVTAATLLAAPGASPNIKPESGVLHLMLPPGYPGPGVAAQVIVTAPSHRRDWEAAASEALQRTADEAAAAGGREVVYELVEALQGLLQASSVEAATDAIDSPSSAGGGADGISSRRKVAVRRPAPHQSGGAGDGGNSGGVSVALLRLDHMRSRAKYSKLIKAWANELELTGRLLFLGQLILILLEGSAQALREYLRRQRTQNVDVDSKGRPCKERMMSVVCEEARAARAFADFCEQELGSREQLEAVLSQAQLQGWMQAATGLAGGSAP